MEYNFPSHDIDPRQKNADWLLQFARAAYHTSKGNMPSTLLFNGRAKMEEIKLYTLGKPPIEKYKKILVGEEQTDQSWMQVNWTPSPILPKFREIAISKLLQRNYNINAYAVDSMAKTDEDKYFAEMMVKIAMRDVARKSGSPLADSPQLQPNPNEPQDIEQLQIEQQYGFKHAMAIQAENAVNLIFQQNKIEKHRKKTVENKFDFGLGGYKEWIDENGMVKFRAVNLENIGFSACKEYDFSDMDYCFEVIEVMVADLVPYFTADQIKDICERNKGQYGNPQSINYNYKRYWDKFKVHVVDLELISYNTYVYKQNLDSRGNVRFGKTEYDDITKTRNINNNGEAEPKYMDNTRKVVYQTMWVIGTDYQYNYGLSPNMKRKQSSWWDTSLSYHLYTWNSYNMQYGSITERMMAIEDDFQLTRFKLQNLKNKLIPYLIDLDLDALENVALGKGGEAMSPDKLIDFMYQNHVMVSRRGGGVGSEGTNYKSVDIRETGMLGAFVQLYQDLDRNYLLMQQVSGLNEFTDGSTPNPKSLTTIANMANQATNNALYLISDAEKNCLLNLADAIIQKIQIAVKIGKVEGYARALGSNAVKFFSVSPDIKLHEFGIFLEDVPTDQEWAELFQDLNIKDSQGLILPEDKIFVKSCRNLKEAADVLAYRVRKRREEMQQQEMAKIQQTIQGQQQSAVITAQTAQQTAQLQSQLNLQEINAKGQWDYIIARAKIEGTNNDSLIAAHAKVIAQQIAAEAKKVSGSKE